jgi:hypothetical protein
LLRRIWCPTAAIDDGQVRVIMTRWTLKPEFDTPKSGIGAAIMCLLAHKHPFDPALDLLHGSRSVIR